MIRRPPRSTRTDTLFPYTTLFRSLATGVYTVGSDLAVQLKFGRLASNRPRARPLNPLSNFYRSADEHWFVHNPRRGAQDWPAFATIAGRSELIDDPRFATGKARRENSPLLVAELDKGFTALPFAEIAARQIGRAHV